MSLVDQLLTEEGVVLHMYLDCAVHPNVTCGVGHALFTVEDALALKWNVKDEQVRADYAFVHSAPPNRIASWYAQFSQARLTPEFVRELLEQDIAKEVARLKRHYPSFDTYPDAAREALSDMAFNLGGNFPLQWPNFTAAVLAGNWKLAALRCHRKPPVNDARNKATAELFLRAVSSPQTQLQSA